MDGMVSDEDGIVSDEDRIASDEDGMVSNGDGMVSDEDGMASDEDGVVSDGDGIVSNEDGVVSDGDGVASDGDGMVRYNQTKSGFYLTSKKPYGTLYRAGYIASAFGLETRAFCLKECNFFVEIIKILGCNTISALFLQIKRNIFFN